eukprot:1141631-Pelagomonas_calceolata.AAC.5
MIGLCKVAWSCEYRCRHSWVCRLARGLQAGGRCSMGLELSQSNRKRTKPQAGILIQSVGPVI